MNVNDIRLRPLQEGAELPVPMSGPDTVHGHPNLLEDAVGIDILLDHRGHLPAILRKQARLGFENLIFPAAQKISIVYRYDVQVWARSLDRKRMLGGRIKE
jgi:hypothetical protein